jgi:hypothetical protein
VAPDRDAGGSGDAEASINEATLERGEGDLSATRGKALVAKGREFGEELIAQLEGSLATDKGHASGEPRSFRQRQQGR